jgi:purine-binding chemotaxis protein CheW
MTTTIDTEPAREAGRSAGQLVVFSLGRDEYALPIGRVQEIIRYTGPRDVGARSSGMRGVISLRGKIVPVCDLGDRLGSGHEHPADAKIVIVENDGRTAGIVVDNVTEVLHVSAEQLDSLPSDGADCMAAIAKIADRLVVVLDPDRMLAGISSPN